MDAVVLLKEDHKTVEGLFKQFEKAGDGAHTTKHKIVKQIIEEHHVVVWMMSELRHLDPTDERYDAKVTVLIENVRHHVEEEHEWFPEVRKSMGRNQLGELGEQMVAAKPHAPRDPLKLASATA